MTLSLVLHLLYSSLPLRHSYFIRHLRLVGFHNRNVSVSASGVFDIPALYKLDYYYYYYARVLAIVVCLCVFVSVTCRYCIKTAKRRL